VAFVVIWRVITHRGVCVAQRCVCGVCGNVESDYAQRCVCGVCGNVESDYAQRCVVCGVCGNVESDYAQRCVLCVAFVVMWRVITHRGVCGTEVCVWRLW